MEKNLLLIYLCFFSIFSFSQEKLLKGKNLINYNQLKFLKTNSEFGKINAINNTTFEVITTVQPKFIFNSASAIPLHKEAVASGRVFLFSFMAKTTKASLETGEAKLNILFKQSKSYKNNIVSTQSISSNWKKYYIPIQSDIQISKNDLGLVLHFGFRPQTFLIKDLKFELYDKGVQLSQLPKTEITYTGMEADANWRKEALKRIESIRKGNINLQFTKNGKPIVGKNVSIELIKHSFPFGGAISARQVIENPIAYQNFKKAFNHVVLENDLKIKSWQWEKKRTRTLQAIEILNNDGYLVKGHVLIWPGFNYLTKEIKKNKSNPKKVTKIIHNHLENILEATNGKVSHWDVVNEAYTNKDLQKITGSEEILFDGFRILKKKNPKIGAFTNEYGIISKGGLDTRKQQWYYNFVKRIDSVTNGLINGIGLQSHIGSDLTPPQKVLEILGFYATLGKQISISEFTMDIQDAAIREQYTRDFMIAAFSHPNVSEFLFWGCVKDERNKVDIYNQDFTVGAMGKAYFSLINKDWKTQFTQQTNQKGILKNRGFYGTYKYSFTNSEGDLVSGTFFLNPKNKNTIHIDLK